MKKLEENGQKVMEGSQKTLSIQKFLSKACSKCDAAFLCQTDFDTHMDMHGSSWSLVLETHYENNNFPVALEVWLVALRLKLRPMQVTHWFQNKRGRERRLLKLKTPYSIVCGLCSASFISDIFLKNHIRLHKGNDRYSCSQCSAVFLSPILKETHELYHTNVPNEKAHLAKDPMIEGQVHRGEEATEDNSDVSEGELQIDESEGFKICLEGNEDENVALNKEPIEKQEVSELPDSEYEPYIEEDSIEENITYEETCSEELEMEKKALASYESQHSVLVGNDDKSNDTECVNTDGDDSNRDTYDGIKREDDSNERTIYDSEMKNNHKTADSERGRDQHETNGCHDLERADDIMEREEKDNSSIETESAPNKISEYGVFEVSSITRGTPLHSEKIPKTRIFYELKHDLNVDSNSKKPEPGIFEESVCDIERHIREENEASNSIKPKPGIFEESMYNFRKHIREENDDSNSKKADPGIFEESICDKSKHIREENEDSNSKKPEPGIFVEPVYDVRNLIREENEESNSKKAEPGIFEEPVYDVGKHMREENEESNSNKLEPGIFKESVYDIKKCIREKNEASNSKMPEVDIFEESVYDIRKHIREEYFFEEDDEESDDDDEDEPRLKIVSAYTMCANSGDVALEEDS
ncbi:hypothetical protein SK128_012733 [Halocaridina rubra]|uniref:Uncharacterized protein n=1 Tax=Halocaridina rubra TaxID=373956 RepID=A0AAN8ZZ86_HALRR